MIGWTSDILMESNLCVFPLIYWWNVIYVFLPTSITFVLMHWLIVMAAMWYSLRGIPPCHNYLSLNASDTSPPMCEIWWLIWDWKFECDIYCVSWGLLIHGHGWLGFGDRWIAFFIIYPPRYYLAHLTHALHSRSFTSELLYVEKALQFCKPYPNNPPSITLLLHPFYLARPEFTTYILESGKRLKF